LLLGLPYGLALIRGTSSSNGNPVASEMRRMCHGGTKRQWYIAGAETPQRDAKAAIPPAASIAISTVRSRSFAMQNI
jgi:hypothetical protein